MTKLELVRRDVKEILGDLLSFKVEAWGILGIFFVISIIGGFIPTIVGVSIYMKTGVVFSALFTGIMMWASMFILGVFLISFADRMGR